MKQKETLKLLPRQELNLKNNIDIKLKDRLDFTDKDFLENTYNPFLKLNYSDNKEKDKSPFNVALLLVVLFLLLVSVLFNSYFQKNIDPILFKITSFDLKNSLIDVVRKPYVVTIGEFGNSALAKEEAIRLVPRLKQVNIKQLENGLYTFYIERFGSKEKAYKYAKELINDGFDLVHVRYIQGILN